MLPPDKVFCPSPAYMHLFINHGCPALSVSVIIILSIPKISIASFHIIKRKSFQTNVMWGVLLPSAMYIL